MRLIRLAAHVTQHQIRLAFAVTVSLELLLQHNFSVFLNYVEWLKSLITATHAVHLLSNSK